MTILTNPTSSLLSFFNLRKKINQDVRDRISFYSQLDMYYECNGLYDTQIGMDAYVSVWDESMKPLRDCSHRVVEFYVSKLEPGTSLPFVAPDKITAAINQVLLWSNFFSKKSLTIRQYSLYGDIFIKSQVSDDKTSVYQTYYAPKYVADYSEDAQGNVTYLRLDIPNGETNYTEVWTLEGYKTYEHRYGADMDIQFLGSPTSEATLESLGIDFIPFTHAKFMDQGGQWGVGCFVHSLDKIDEANRMATRLHQMMFRYGKPLWVATAGGMDASGKPLPPVKANAANNVDMDDDTILSMPGASDLKGLVADLPYADYLATIDAQVHEIERDLPELAYFDLKDKGQISGKAVQQLLGDAVDKVLEARANLETALIKANKQCLTLGMVNGIFSGLGSYDAGSFDHTIKERPVFPNDNLEMAQTMKTFKDAGLGLRESMRLAGFEQELIDQLVPENPKPVVPVIVPPDNSDAGE